MNDLAVPDSASLLIGAELPHESARLHVAGEATYIDDIAEPPGTLLPSRPTRSTALSPTASVFTEAPACVMPLIVTESKIGGNGEVRPMR